MFHPQFLSCNMCCKVVFLWSQSAVKLTTPNNESGILTIIDSDMEKHHNIPYQRASVRKVEPHL